MLNNQDTSDQDRNLSEQIKHKAVELGFDLVGITSAEPLDRLHSDYMRKWLDRGYAGKMEYLNRNFEKRFHPAGLLKGAKSVICAALNYKPPKSILKTPDDNRHHGAVANYAIYTDYHTFIGQRLKKLAEWLKTITEKEIKTKVCVDTAPVAEHALAQRAGIGFIGKNHQVINPVLGCQLLLGEILTTLELETDTPAKNACAECDICIRACPTGAIDKNGGFNATRCISYLTGELKDEIPDEFKPLMSDCVFRCDKCITACPYDMHGPEKNNSEFIPVPERKYLDLEKILSWTQEDFEILFKDTPVEWTGLEKLKSNAGICLDNAKRTGRDT